jgi:hypothetical protein
VDDCNGEVDQAIPVRSDVQGAIKTLLIPLRHAANLDLVRLVHEAFQLQQTLSESAAFYSLQILLELALDLSLKTGNAFFCLPH